jgi:hypothetical protein
MTPYERLALDALAQCSFPVGSRHKYFARDVAAKPMDYILTSRQSWNLWRLCWRYRRQVPREVSDMALQTWAGAACPPLPEKPSVKKAVERKTKFDKAREVLRQPVTFGDVELAAANRLLARER